MRARLTAWIGRHPLFAAALVVAVAVVFADWHSAAGLLVGTGFALFPGNRKRAWAWLACVWLSVGVFTGREAARDVSEQALLKSGVEAASARVLKDGHGGNGYWEAPAVLDTGEKIVWKGRGEPPVEGAVVKGGGNFEALPIMRNPGEFDQAAWLRRQGVAAVFHAKPVGAEVMTGRWAALGARIRKGFREAVTAGLPEDSREARVIRAVVIGEYPPDADELVGVFRNSGTLHIFSVSGMHVAMVGAIFWFALRWIGISRRWAVVVLLPVVFGYSWISGNSAPAVRSIWMAAVFLGAFVFRRRPDLLNALGAVLLAALLWDGRLLFQPGFQLSYGVVAAIAVGTAWAARWFRWMDQPELYLPVGLMTRWQEMTWTARKWLAGSLAASTAAWAGSTPLTIFHFGLVTPVSIIAGIPIALLVFALLALALLATALYPVLPGAARWVNRANGRVANGCVHSAEFFSSIPGGNFQVGGSGEPFLLVYDLEYGAGAACFSAGNDGAVLLDCGDSRTFKRNLAPSLRKLGVSPDSVVLSHPDGGHLGGGTPVWEAFPIRQVWLPVERSRSPAFRRWVNDAPRAGIRTFSAGNHRDLPMPDGARLEILHVPDSLAQNARADERVAIFRLHWRGWKVLFASDAGMTTELALLRSGKEISADLIIAGRHSDDLTLGDAFLDAVNPQAIIASNAAFPVEERLDPRQSAYWISRGILAIDQAKTGGVTVKTDESGDLLIEGFVDRSKVRLKRR